MTNREIRLAAVPDGLPRPEHFVPAAQCRRLDGTLPDPVAHISDAWTAYSALSDVRPGDTVFVTGGAGGVGSMAGQIAEIAGLTARRNELAATVRIAGIVLLPDPDPTRTQAQDPVRA
ncbi:hypothetical protein [Actinomadura sp. 9N407]|uniref:hypothetical protein n=1 Tax=Actinomadura sp. 9N407 TaxID=3375154 RepID=UPI0037B8C5AD